MSIQIKKKFIKSQVIDGTKVLFLNEDSFKALNSQGQTTELFKLSSGDKLVMLQNPQFASDPVADDDLARKKYVDDSLETEMMAREAGDEQLAEDLAAETSARVAADAALAGDILALQTQVGSDLQGAIETLQDSIEAEQAAREAEDLTFLKHDGSRPMTGSLNMGGFVISNAAPAVFDTDVPNAGQVFQDITDAVASEAEAREAADTALQSNIAAEETRALAAEFALSGEIASEAAAREAADIAEATARDAAILVETNNRIAADNLLLPLDGSRAMVGDLSMGGFAPGPVNSSEFSGSNLTLYMSPDYQFGDMAKALVIVDIGSALTGSESLYAPMTGGSFTFDYTILIEGMYEAYMVGGPGFDPNTAVKLGVLRTEPPAFFPELGPVTNYKVIGVADGVDANDAVNKGQLDFVVAEFGEVLMSQMAAEVAAREAADAALQSNIDAEETRAMAAEGVLQSNIDVEKGRIDAILLASDADKDSFAEIVALINSVDTENDTAFGSYVISNNAALAGEVAARIAGDSALQSEIDAEEVARAAADTTLQSNIDAEETRALAAEAGLASDIADEESRAMAAEGVLQSNIDAEVAARITAVSAEQSAREAADSALDGRLDILEGADSVEGSVAKAEKDAKDYTDQKVLEINSDIDDLDGYAQDVRDDLDQEILDRIADVDAEETRALAAEAALSALIASEASARAAADSSLQGEIDAVEAGLAQEILDRVAADSTEASARTSADSALSGRLDVLEGADTVEGSVAKAEKDAKDHADSIVATEAGLRAAADSAEASAREAADLVLQSNIDVEKGRIDAILLAADADKDSFAEIVALINSVDTENDSAFASYVLSNNAALAAEVSAREAADVVIDSRLDALEANNYVFAKESFTLTSGDLVYIDLGYEVEANSICAFVDRLGLHKDEDFTVSVVGGKTRLTWAGSVMASGDEALVAGDKIKVTYARRV